MRASVALPSATNVAAGLARRLAGAAVLAERRRWAVVSGCILVQLLAAIVAAAVFIHHNGWIYQSGDDGPWYWTTAWALSSFHVPQTAVGLGWPYLLTPLAALFGPNMANGLPAVLALNLLVLAPVSVVGMYLIGERIAGRLFGLWTAVLWTVAPLLALVLYDESHRQLVVDTFLPTATGLNTLSDYPSMVFAIVAAYLLLRALDSNTIADGALCGLLFGFLVLMKPANGPLPLVGVIVLGLAFRFRAVFAVLVTMVPALITLTIWKKVGGGEVPLLAQPGSSGGSGGGDPTTVPIGGAPRYLSIDWHHLSQNSHALGQVFWSVRLLELLFIAGAIGLIARARFRGLLVVGWFVVFGLIKGSVSYSSVYDTSLYRFLLPSWPAWVLIVAGVVFCWPGGPAMRMRQRARDRNPSSPTIVLPMRRVLLVAGLIFAAGPLAFALAARPVGKETIAQMNYTGAPVAIVDFGLRAQRRGAHAIHLEWSRVHTNRATGWYQVFKAKDAGCNYPSLGAADCLFRMQLVYSTRNTSFDDTQASGDVFYRVALAAGGRIDSNTSSYLLLSKPVTVSVP
jgi:hypothetical protein